MIYNSFLSIDNIKKYFKFIKSEYIAEDWSIVTKTGKVFLKPAWFIRSIYVYLFSIIFFPLVLLHMNYTEAKDFGVFFDL